MICQDTFGANKLFFRSLENKSYRIINYLEKKKFLYQSTSFLQLQKYKNNVTLKNENNLRLTN